MYSVILHPQNCPNGKASWVSNHKDGDRKELSDSHYHYHKAHGCMEAVEHYRSIIVSDKPCKTCGHRIIKRQKKVIP